MALSATNLRVGDCEAFLDLGDGNGEQFLGQTKGGSEMNVDRELLRLTVDKYGTAPLDIAVVGNVLQIKLFLAEPTNKNLHYSIPEGKYATGTVDDKVGIGRESGYLLSALPGLLRLHPRKNLPTNTNEDIYVWKAVSVEKITLPFKSDEQRILEVTFEGLVDETKSDGEHLGRVGNEAIS